MSTLIVILSMYLTYYTGACAVGEWKHANKGAGIVLFLFAGCFLPIAIGLLVFHRL